MLVVVIVVVNDDENMDQCFDDQICPVASVFQHTHQRVDIEQWRKVCIIQFILVTRWLNLKHIKLIDWLINLLLAMIHDGTYKILKMKNTHYNDAILVNIRKKLHSVPWKFCFIVLHLIQQGLDFVPVPNCSLAEVFFKNIISSHKNTKN